MQPLLTCSPWFSPARLCLMNLVPCRMVSDAVWAPAADSPNKRKYGRSSSSEALIPISEHPLGELVHMLVSHFVCQPHTDVAGTVRHCRSSWVILA